jgi:hypothetical protein
MRLWSLEDGALIWRKRQCGFPKGKVDRQVVVPMLAARANHALATDRERTQRWLPLGSTHYPPSNIQFGSSGSRISADRPIPQTQFPSATDVIPATLKPSLVPDRGSKMAIQRLLRHLELEADAVRRLVTAYEETLRALRLVDRTDPITDLVARKVIEIGRSGDRDAAEISSLAVRQLGSP